MMLHDRNIGQNLKIKILLLYRSPIGRIARVWNLLLNLLLSLSWLIKLGYGTKLIESVIQLNANDFSDDIS